MTTSGLQIAAAVAGFLGSVLLAVSQGAGSEMFALLRGNTKMLVVVVRFPRLWRLGFVLLCLAFVLQIGSLLKGGA